MITGFNGYDAVVYTDGSCLCNPGGAGGWAVVVLTDEGQIEKCGGVYSSTNNRMELRAILEGLRATADAGSVLVCSDSEYAINTSCGIWRKNTNFDLHKQISEVSSGRKIKYRWVRGHNGNRYNERCDTLAMQGACNPTEADTGYDGQVIQRIAKNNRFVESGQGAQSKTGSMGVRLNIPENLGLSHDDFPQSRQEIVEKYGIKPKCALLVKTFREKTDEKKFKDYASLKTDGIDSLSRLKKDDLIEKIPDGEAVWDAVTQYIPYQKDAEAVLRWHLRGLPLHDAVRKGLVDAEIRDNMSQKWR